MGSDDYNRHSPGGSLWKRTTNAVGNGGIFRTLLRFFALLMSLVILGINKLQCTLNYMGNNDITWVQGLGFFWDVISYGYQRASILLWSEFSNLTAENVGTNLGDNFILIMFICFVFLALYSMVSIVADWFDGSEEDKAPFLMKIVITLGFLVIFSAIFFYASDKPDGNYYVNSNLILTNAEKEICLATGEVSFFVAEDSIKTSGMIIKNDNSQQNNVEEGIPNNSNNTINIYNQEEREIDKSIELINMLNE